MKHNIWFIKLVVFSLMVINSSYAFAKIINSEFLNQADVGSEGPQLIELELAGTRAYMLSYNTNKPGQEPKFRNLTQKEYRKLQAQMRNIIKTAGAQKTKDQICDREITYTQVDEESKINNKSFCWASLGPKKRTQISDWFIEVRKSL